MALPVAAVAWLRAFDPSSPGDPVAAACTLGLLAHRTPAWTERYVELLGALAATGDGDAGRLAATIAGLVAGLPDAADEAQRLLGSAGIAEPAPGTDGAWSVAASLGIGGGWTALFAAPLPACAQIVGVDANRLLLSRAEWWRDCLLLTLSPHEPAPGSTTEFRLVGAEPRVWCQAGIDGARTEITGHGVIVRAPLVAGDLEFTPGSY